MQPQTVFVVVGSRPEAIKLAPVIFALRDLPARFETVLCSTGQQRHLIPQALAEFGLEPAIELDVMREDQTLADLTSRLVSGLDAVLARIKPDWVLVQGDTTTTMAGALAAFYRRIPVAHVEAGLRRVAYVGRAGGQPACVRPARVLRDGCLRARELLRRSRYLSADAW
jgi:UDP-N-acetylglucosamine 2-epimerase (non-hydrolysing)